MYIYILSSRNVRSTTPLIILIGMRWFYKQLQNLVHIPDSTSVHLYTFSTQILQFSFQVKKQTNKTKPKPVQVKRMIQLHKCAAPSLPYTQHAPASRFSTLMQATCCWRVATYLTSLSSPVCITRWESGIHFTSVTCDKQFTTVLHACSSSSLVWQPA